jgi:RNase P subunit RPR2
MKKILIILTLASTACNQDAAVSKIETSRDCLSKKHINLDRTVKEVTYDNCEYIIIENGNGTWGCHKGSCKNIIHSYR